MRTPTPCAWCMEKKNHERAAGNSKTRQGTLRERGGHQPSVGGRERQRNGRERRGQRHRRWPKRRVGGRQRQRRRAAERAALRQRHAERRHVRPPVVVSGGKRRRRLLRRRENELPDPWKRGRLQAQRLQELRPGVHGTGDGGWFPGGRRRRGLRGGHRRSRQHPQAGQGCADRQHKPQSQAASVQTKGQ
jgi:hypothetical protein